MNFLPPLRRSTRRASTGRDRLLHRFETLEIRLPLDAAMAGFVADTEGLFYEVVGTDTADTITLKTNSGGESSVTVANAAGTSLHTISAEAITEAQITTGKTYAGIRILSLGGDDLVNASKLTGDQVHVFGGAGKDLIVGSPNQDHLHGGDADDVIFGGGEADFLNGGAGNDYLNGEGGADEMRAGVGDDVVVADADDVAAGKQLIGGSGTDRIDFSASGPGTGFIWMGKLLDGVDFVNNSFDRVVGSKYADRIDNVNYFDGDLRVWARGGDDVILASEFPDLIDGQAGSDWISFERQGGGPGVKVDLAAAVQSSPGTHADGDVLSGIENIVGSHNADVLLGDDGPNILVGLDGTDDLIGRRGDDILLGGKKGDRLFGGPGDDYLDGGEGRDQIAGGTGLDMAVLNWDRDVTGSNPDRKLNLGNKLDIVLYEQVFTLGVVDPSKVSDIDNFLNGLHDIHRSDFDEDVDQTQWFDTVADPAL